MKLIEPTMEYDQQIQAYRQEFLAFGGSMDGCGSLRKFERTQDWLDQVESLKNLRQPLLTGFPVRNIFSCGNRTTKWSARFKSGIISMNFWKNMLVI